MSGLKGKKVLVTGGCGFIGTNLIEGLQLQGAAVTVLDLPSANWDRVPDKVHKIKADILQKEDLEGVFKGIEIIYHLAARTDIDGKSMDDYEVNFIGTQNVIEEAMKEKDLERFLFYSTQLVVGLFDETRFIDESEPYRTKTHYGQSKIEGEKVVKEACKKARIAYTIIRPTSVYGPWGEEPYKEFFRAIKKSRYAHVGKAKNLVSWVYVKNLVDLTILASISKKAENEIFFGNDFHPYTMREIVNTVADYYKVRIHTVSNTLITIAAYGFGVLKLLGLKVPIYPFRLRNIKSNYCYDISKSVGIGYYPHYDLHGGIKETLDWYEGNKLFS